MNRRSPGRERLAEAFERAEAIFDFKSPEEKLIFLQEVGALSKEGQLTKLYGGDAPGYDEAVEERERDSKELFAALR